MKTARTAGLIILLLMSLQTAWGRAVTRDTETGRKTYSARNYRHALVGKSAATRVGTGAVWGQMWNHPKEWGRGVGGFGKRLASGAATHAVGTTIEYGVGHALHEERSYQRSDDPRFRARLKSAFGNTFLAYHRGSNKRRPAVGHISGAVGGGLVSRLWAPASVHTAAAGFGSAGIALGADFGVNLAREYMPRHHTGVSRVHRRRRVNA